MFKSTLLLLLGGVLCGMGFAQSPQQASQCPLELHPVVQLYNPSSMALNLHNFYYVLDKQIFLLEGNGHTLAGQSQEQLILPALTLDEGMHILEVYWDQSEATPVTAHFGPLAEQVTVDLSEAPVVALTGTEPEAQDCACLHAPQGEQARATLWLNRTQSSINEPLLFLSYDNGQAWTKQIGQRSTPCPSFEIAGPATQQLVSPATEIQKVAEADGFSLEAYPVPFTDKLFLTSHFPTTTTLSAKAFTLNGQLMWTYQADQLEAGSHTLQVDTHAWAAGTYLIMMQTKEGMQVRQVVCHR